MVHWPYNGGDGWRVDDTMVALSYDKQVSFPRTNKWALSTYHVACVSELCAEHDTCTGIRKGVEHSSLAQLVEISSCKQQEEDTRRYTGGFCNYTIPCFVLLWWPTGRRWTQCHTPHTGFQKNQSLHWPLIPGSTVERSSFSQKGHLALQYISEHSLQTLHSLYKLSSPDRPAST